MGHSGREMTPQRERISPMSQTNGKERADIVSDYRVLDGRRSRSPGSASPPESPQDGDANSDMDEFMESENEDGALNLVNNIEHDS